MKTYAVHIPTEDLPFENIMGLDLLVEVDDAGNISVSTRPGKDVSWVSWSPPTVGAPVTPTAHLALVPEVSGG